MSIVKTSNEYYRVMTDVGAGRPGYEGRFESISDAVEHAMRITLNRKIGCAVERVTVHEALQDVFGREFTETVTGRVSIPGPLSYTRNPELSRYHPVNGWVVPDTIDSETDGR